MKRYWPHLGPRVAGHRWAAIAKSVSETLSLVATQVETAIFRKFVNETITLTAAQTESAVFRGTRAESISLSEAQTGTLAGSSSAELLDFNARGNPAIAAGGWAQRFLVSTDVGNWRFTNGVGWDPNPAGGSAGSKVRLGTGGAIPGDGCIEIEQTLNGNTSGYWSRSFDAAQAHHNGNSPSAVARGPGQEFCLQLRFKTNCGQGGGSSGQGTNGQGRKLYSFTRAEQSNVDPGQVFQDTEYRGVHHGYSEHNFVGFEESAGGSDFNEQPGSLFAEAGGAGYCSYQALNGSGDRTDCWRLDYGYPEWQTHLIHIIPSSDGVANGLIEVFAWVPGVGLTDYVRILRKANFAMFYAPGQASPIGFSTFLCWIYETIQGGGTGRTVGPAGQFQWYDQPIYHPGVSTIPLPGKSSALALKAASMSSGQWAQMSPTPAGLNLFANVTWPFAQITGYATKMARDTANRYLYYIGCDHGTPDIFVRYDEASNAWKNYDGSTSFFNGQSVPWGITSIGGGGQTSHGYEHTVFEPNSGTLWHRVFGERAIRRWNGGLSWTSFPYTSAVTYGDSAGVAWFPERNQFILFQSNGSAPNGICIGIATDGTVTTILSGGVLNPMGEPETFCQYSVKKKCVVMGGGAGTTKLWRLNATGAPFLISDNKPGNLGNLGPNGVGGALPVINPVTGNLMVFQSASVWYEYDLDTGVWTTQGGAASIFSANLFDSGGPAFGTFACPIPEYGVIVFIKAYSGTSPAQMWLWKP